MNTKTETLRTLIKEITPTTIFSVDFIKKDGSARTMTCRLGVTKHLKGGELPFDPIEKGLLPVYDMEAAAKLGFEASKQGDNARKEMSKAYRMINLDTVTELRANGQVYRFE